MITRIELWRTEAEELAVEIIVAGRRGRDADEEVVGELSGQSRCISTVVEEALGPALEANEGRPARKKACSCGDRASVGDVRMQMADEDYRRRVAEGGLVAHIARLERTCRNRWWPVLIYDGQGRRIVAEAQLSSEEGQLQGEPGRWGHCRHGGTLADKGSRVAAVRRG